MFLIALYLQNALGLTALQAGLTTFPSARGTMLGAQLVTRKLYRRYGPRRVTTFGLLFIALATGLLAFVGDLWLIRGAMVILGLGVSAVFVPAQTFSMATVDKAATARASALFTAGKQVGSAIGVALLGAILAAGTGITAFHVAFAAAAVVALLALAVPAFTAGPQPG